MKKKVILLIIMLLITLCLVNCKEEKDYTIYEGMVVDKIFDNGYTYITYVQSGKTRIPITHHVPDKYYILILTIMTVVLINLDILKI